MNPITHRWGQNQRGSASVELVLVVPALVLMLGLLVAGGRLWFARSAVTDAAYSAARAASLSRTADQAITAGQDAAQATLRTGDLECIESSIEIDASGFAVAPGLPATVTSHIDCTVTLRDVALPGLPGTITLSADGAAALDTYRSRQ